MRKLKITNAQLDLLQEVASDSHVHAVEGYKPRQRLLELGLIELVGGKYTDRLRLTQAGRDYLNERGSDGR